ncbi:PLP-dependent aminotransferase family protein [Acidisoma cellulosilytica]|uniref:PLP-dependent aminotransferase family protein n=1 Tax=Acidisoma cellulosilyticum TaxID=2802395 RepID=A0A964E546_9PROT|nr:PLP-dependent aminotransferase family protein [Acidisoma cellulosilyticum]MCB8881613.1 PLP-dependent aminotransferase family protein [Acidisoma cellulosilyticum]
MVTDAKTALVSIDRAAGDLEGQLYRALRGRILARVLPAEARLPSTRQLALSLGLARSTVVSAYGRLKAEGYLTSLAGGASRVAAIASPGVAVVQPTPAISAAAALPLLPLTPGVPDLASFPTAIWGRLLAARARRVSAADLGYGAPLGLPALAEAILAHIAVSRGVVADPDQLVLFPSTRAAIGLLARLALRDAAPGHHAAWMEEPGYLSARQILQDAGADLVPVPVDEAGMNVDSASGAASPKLIYVTPSHQYPTGMTMSLARRLALLAVAQRTGALILEDDYDSEFQFDGRPIAALQGIDQSGVVAYLGTLSKVLAPGVRLAYAIVPRSLLLAVQQAVRLQGLSVPIHIQAACLEFLREGHFRAHIRRMTPIYAARMTAFRDTVQYCCGDAIATGPGTGGLQLALWFRDEAKDDEAIVQRLRSQGYGPQALSSMHLAKGRPGLLCGIAGLHADKAEHAARAIAAAHQEQRLINGAAS